MSNRMMPHCGKFEDAGAISWSNLLRMSDLTEFARPFRYRVVRDVEGYRVLPGRLGKSRPMTVTSFRPALGAGGHSTVPGGRPASQVVSAAPSIQRTGGVPKPDARHHPPLAHDGGSVALMVPLSVVVRHELVESAKQPTLPKRIRDTPRGSSARTASRRRGQSVAWTGVSTIRTPRLGRRGGSRPSTGRPGRRQGSDGRPESHRPHRSGGALPAS